MDYPVIAIKALINALDDDKQAYQWLTESKWKELAAFHDAMYASENEKAIVFLIQNQEKFFTIVHFFGAIHEQEKAFQLLMDNRDSAWAATASVINGSRDARLWLRRNNFDLYIELADVIIKNKPYRNSYSSNEW
jgi:hypothetical protein